MTQIIHWKGIVGEENIDTFTKIQKAIIFAERNRQTENDVFAKMKDREDDIEMWKTKRRLMRFCGYDGDNKKLGWYRGYIDGNELKFSTTATPDRKYISLPHFLDMKKQLQQDADEADYYGETQKLIKDLARTKPTNGTGRKTYKVTQKPRADLDGFTHEEE